MAEDKTEVACQIEHVRAQFEAWANGSYHLQRIGDTYRSVITASAWCAWQAAIATAQPKPSAALVVTDAMVQAYSEAYAKNWEAQGRAPDDSPELGTFFAMRAGLQAALAVSQSVDLVRFRESIVQAISNVSYMTGEGAAYTKLVELLALIDGQKK